MKKSIKLLLIAFGCVFLITAIVKAQETQPTVLPAVSLGENVTMKIGGFLRADAYYDTRKNAEILDGLLDLYPLPEAKDVNGEDMNAFSPFRMSAAASRVNTKFTGPDVLNAKTSSLVEFDFTGYNGIGLRLRHAWLKLNWQNSELLMGRFWHPMFILDAFPTVLGLSTGAPFNVFNRCEQIRYTYTFGSISIMGAASAQMDYGFQTDATKTIFYHNQVMPDLSANIQFKNDMFIFGATGNYKVNQPFTAFTNKAGVKQKVDSQIASMAAEAYAQFKTGNLKIKGSALYGQNMHELLMLGGFAVKDTTAAGVENYTPINNMSVWGNILYGDKLQVGIFVGYSKNLGTSSATILSLYGNRNDIDKLIRIAPSVNYKVGRLQFSAEIEHSICTYGVNNKADHAKVINTTNVSNTRLQLASIFYF